MKDKRFTNVTLEKWKNGITALGQIVVGILIIACGILIIACLIKYLLA